MIVTIPLSELLECRRVDAGLNFSRTDCAVELVEGISPDERWAQQIRHRYADLLLTADPMLLPVEEIHSDITLSPVGCDSAIAILPANASRLLNIRLRSWLRPARVEYRGQLVSDGRGRCALNYFCAPGPNCPAAILEPSGEVTLMPFSGDDAVERAMAVVRPADPDLFALDESLIPRLLAP